MLGLCERFKKLPGEVYAEDARDLWRLLQIEAMGKRPAGAKAAPDPVEELDW